MLFFFFFFKQPRTFRVAQARVTKGKPWVNMIYQRAVLIKPSWFQRCCGRIICYPQLLSSLGTYLSILVLTFSEMVPANYSLELSLCETKFALFSHLPGVTCWGLSSLRLLSLLGDLCKDLLLCFYPLQSALRGIEGSEVYSVCKCVFCLAVPRSARQDK